VQRVCFGCSWRATAFAALLLAGGRRITTLYTVS